MMRVATSWVAGVSLLAFITQTTAGADAPGATPEFQEVYDLLQANMPGLKPQDLDHAAAVGLALALSPRVSIVTNSSPASESQSKNTMVQKSNLFDGQIAYAQISRVAEGLPNAVLGLCREMGKTNKLKGVVLDLRYAGGDDYPAAAATAEVFVRKEQTLLNWGTGEYHSKNSDDRISLPVAVLVNHDTSGAAEALAGVIRQAGAGLVLGSKTSGQAMVAREFPLKNGARLRIATARVMLGDGTALSAQGLAPDINVDVTAADERAYYSDAFKAITKPSSASTIASGPAAAGTNTTATASARSRRPRYNEAELVRERREGVPLDADLGPEREGEPDRPVVRDPVLARALDLLKGLAVVRQAPS